MGSRRLAPPLTPAEMNAPWRRRAACRDEDLNLFFAERGDNESGQRAKEICAGCPVRQACLNFAITNNELAGIWGGFSRKARKRIRKSREAA